MVGHTGPVAQVAHHVDDAALRPLPKVRQHRLAGVVCAENSAVKLALIGLPRHTPKTRSVVRVEGIGAKGVVDHHVYSPQFGQRLCDHGIDRPQTAHIGSDGQRISA